MKKMKRMGLQGLTEMQQAAQLLGRGREPLHADQLIHRLGRRQLMTDRANPAQPLDDEWHFPVGTPLNEFFKTAKLDDVETCLMNMVFCVEQQCDLAMPLNTGDGVDGNAPEIGRSANIGLRFGVLFHSRLPLIVMQQIMGK